jgi:hypothetical protein
MTRRTLTGHLSVALPPDQAFSLFTARGEQKWVPHWEPSFPASVVDDAAPGTVFQTHDPTSTWIVIDSTPGRHIRYSRVTPGTSAGTVSVTLDEAGGHSDVTVTYDLTALTDAGAVQLSRFADGYRDFLAGWQDAIAMALETR